MILEMPRPDATPDSRADLLDAYGAAVEKMRRSRPRVPAGRWWQVMQDAEAIMTRWGPTAAALGWPADNLFGRPPEEGECGCLAWEMQGGYVRLMTAGMIVFDRPDVCCRGFFRRA